MVMEECFLEWPKSRFSGKARKQVFWKGEKAGFLGRPESRFSGKAKKTVFQTLEGLVASISTELFRHSGGGFSDQIKSYIVHTSLR